jgi:acetyl-CoA acetyltransferase
MTGHTFDEWFVAQFGQGYEASAAGVDKAVLAEVFESMIVGPPEDRREAVEELQDIGDPKQRKLAWQRINRDRAGTGWQIFEQAERWADKLKADAQRKLKAEEKRARKRKH